MNPSCVPSVHWTYKSLLRALCVAILLQALGSLEAFLFTLWVCAFNTTEMSVCVLEFSPTPEFSSHSQLNNVCVWWEGHRHLFTCL